MTLLHHQLLRAGKKSRDINREEDIQCYTHLSLCFTLPPHTLSAAGGWRVPLLTRRHHYGSPSLFNLSFALRESSHSSSTGASRRGGFRGRVNVRSLCFCSTCRVVSCRSVQIKEHSAVLHPGFDLDGYYNSCFLHSFAISWERFSLLSKMWCRVVPGTRSDVTVCDIKIGYLIKPHQWWIFDC